MTDKQPDALALAEPAEQEPVALLHDDGYWTAAKTDAGRRLSEHLLFAGSPSIMVYTAPQPAKPAEPVAAQHRFRRPEKGTPDWSVWQPCKINNRRPAHEIDTRGYQVEYRALYTAPQPAKREPLTDEEIDNTTRKQVDDLLDHIYEYGTAAEGIIERVRAIARAIERAHGIGEQP